MRIALLISGGGTTMEAIIKACQSGSLPDVFPVLVIASKENIGGIEKARLLGIKDEDIIVINPKDFNTRESFGEKIIQEAKKRKVDFIGQYGWLVMTPKNVIDTFEGMIVNQHPGPLDTGRLDFGGVGMYGMRVHAARLSFVNKVKRDYWTEATAHRVTTKFDEGAIVKRKKVPIESGDTPEILQKRVLLAEYEVQIEALRDFANKKVVEYKRENPLVLKGEEDLLEESKLEAIKLYPNG